MQLLQSFKPGDMLAYREHQILSTAVHSCCNCSIVQMASNLPEPVANLLQIATVDKYQGQQNDYILLSLVRTRAVGHIRDVRRLVVALSRARLGLYIFGRAELFANCYELRPAMKQLLARPKQLHLHPSERVAVSTLP